MKLIKVTLFLLAGCVGVDQIDDPIVEPKLIVLMDQAAIQIGGCTTLEVSYYNQYGVVEFVSGISWESGNATVASVNSNGLVMGVMAGQAYVVAEYESLKDSALVTVVSDDEAVSSVSLSTPKTEISVSEVVELTISIQNISGEELTDKVPAFESSDENVLTVSNSGVITGISNGTASVTATVEGVTSPPLLFTVGKTELTGTFQGNGGYTAEGTATLSRNSENDLILTFSNDFATSFALGTFVYLANTTNGSQVRSNGLELGEITTNGAKEFNVSDFNSSASLGTYQYVIILCKPASITFGFAELE